MLKKVVFINFPVNCGKTFFLSRIVKRLREKGKKITGFLAFKKRINKTRVYYINVLGEKKSYKLVEVNGEKMQINCKVFKDIRKKILKKIKMAEFVLIDEIGPLEIAGFGHYLLLKEILRIFNGYVLIAVRQGIEKRVKKVFNIKFPVYIKKKSIKTVLRVINL